ncbi:MAG: hypothetical protein M1379_06975, partial [Firmicutes bacterium]|nr:hypothetical protein [Bacillota bacterium]
VLHQNFGYLQAIQDLMRLHQLVRIPGHQVFVLAAQRFELLFGGLSSAIRSPGQFSTHRGSLSPRQPVQLLVSTITLIFSPLRTN